VERGSGRYFELNVRIPALIKICYSFSHAENRRAFLQEWVGPHNAARPALWGVQSFVGQGLLGRTRRKLLYLSVTAGPGIG
jgi:hypothetical protein